MVIPEKYNTIIVGGGIGGSAAALRAAQNGQKALWLLGNKQTRTRSRSQWVMNLDNIIGYHEDIIKSQVLKTLKRGKYLDAAELVAGEHYHINNRTIIQNTVERIQKDYPLVVLVEEEAVKLVKDGERFVVGTLTQSFSGTAVVLATGVMDEQPQIRKMGKTGGIEQSPKWIYPFANREQILYCIRCEGHLTKDEAVAVIGFNEVVAELAMMLYERYGNKVYILTNGAELQVSQNRQKILDHYDIKIVTEPIADFLSEGVKQLHGFIYEDHATVEVKFALVSLGLYRVYNGLARRVGARLMDEELPKEKRPVWINHKGETSIPNLFVVGDAAKREDEPMMKQVYTAQEYAVRAVDVIDTRRRKRMREKVLADS